MSLWSYIKTCLINGCKNEVDFQGHHIKHRASGGSDGPWNRLKICRIHHTEFHNIGHDTFLKKYPEVKSWIEWGEKVEKVWQLEKVGNLKNPSGAEKGILLYIQRVRKSYSKGLNL